MTSSLFLRIKPLNIKTMRGVTSSASVIRVAALHNLRELAAELGVNATSGIDPSRIRLNYQLRGPDTAAGVADLAQALLDNAGVQKLRRDACMALELVFSLPQGSAVDHRQYFAAAVAWADGFFNVPILSAAVHLDEPAKHCHVLLLPLVDGRMQGGALAGGPTKIRMMLADFQQQVGQRFGLAHQPRAKRHTKENRDAAGRMVLNMLKAHPERLNVPAVRDALVAALGQHHETLLPLLDLALPAPAKAKGKSFAAIMTAPCKPERPAGKRTSIHVAKPKSIHVESSSTATTHPESSNVYLCVHVAPPDQAFPPASSTKPIAAPPANREVNGEASQPEAGAQWSAAQRSTTGSEPMQLPAVSRTRVASTAAAPVPASALQPFRSTPTIGGIVQPGPSAHDVSSYAHVSPVPAVKAVQLPDTPKTRPTNFVQLVEQQAGAAETDASTFGRIPSFGGTPADDPDGGYHRQRDDDHPAECWDSERGEFVTAPGTATRPPYNARASPAALAHHLLALANTIEHEPLIEQKADHEQDTA